MAHLHAPQFNQSYHDPSKVNFKPNFFYSLKPYLDADQIWLCPAAARQDPVRSEFRPSYQGPLIAYMGNMFVIRTIRGFKISRLPAERLDQFHTPNLVRLFTDVGASAQTVWTGATAPASASEAYGVVGPIPVHHLQTKWNAGTSWNNGGGAGINALHGDGHVEFYGGARYEEGPGKVDDDEVLFRAWWQEGIKP